MEGGAVVVFIAFLELVLLLCVFVGLDLLFGFSVCVCVKLFHTYFVISAPCERLHPSV